MPQLNIIGAGQGWNLAPPKNCWGVNKVIFKRPIDLLFDMHDHLTIEGARKEKCLKIAEQCRLTNTPAYSIRLNDHFGYLRYPIEQIYNRFKTKFFSNGICYMISLALYQGMDRLDFYGINHMKVNGKEYSKEKPGVDFWLGVATGMGVEWKSHGNLSQIGKTFNGLPYGYETNWCCP